MNAWRDLFPAENFRFRMAMRRGDPADFFRAQDHSGELLRERRRWIEQDSARYVIARPEAAGLLGELSDMAAAWGLGAVASIGEVGARLEPDILLLSPDDHGVLRLRAGALCFPTGWALAEKLGKTMADIHGIVPGLNPAIGASIDQFLRGLRPGIAFHRDNWGIVATGELNLHPSRKIPSPQLPIDLSRLWLRVEDQALVAMPINKGILFGIRIGRFRLDEVVRDKVAAEGLRQALATMSTQLIAYKGLTAVAESLAEALAASR